MSKTTFAERFEKAGKFYDNGYHHHKATFKGLGEFYRNYGGIEKDYAGQLLKLSEGVTTSIVDFAKELPYIQTGIREVCSNLERVSQLHFNYGERLREIGESFREEYQNSKKIKQKFMKLRVERSQQEHEKVKDSKNRNMLNEKQKEICKNLYQCLDSFLQDETNRTQKLKEQLVIYFSLSKKIAEKELELAGAYAIKMVQYDIQIRVPQIQEIQDLLIDQFNGYGEEKLEKKGRDLQQQVNVNRQSLRESLIQKERLTRLEDSASKIIKIVEKYGQVPEELNYPQEEQQTQGLFDPTILTNHRKFSRQFKSDSLKELSFCWLSSYCNQSGDEEAKSLLTVIKTNLKVKGVQTAGSKTSQQFFEMISQQSQEYRWTVHFLLQLSRIYDGHLQPHQLDETVRKRKSMPADVNKGEDKVLHWKISLVIVDCLLESTIIVRDGFSILYDEYIDILKLIVRFAKQHLATDTSVAVLLLLSKLIRVLTVTNSPDEEPIEQLLTEYPTFTDDYIQSEGIKSAMGHRLIHFLTAKMSVFYKSKVAFPNLVKISILLQRLLPKNYFSAVEHMHKCIKLAGFNFFQQADEDRKLLQAGVWRGEERLRNLTEVLEQAEYGKISECYMEPMAGELSKLLGVGREVVEGKMMREFSQSMFEVTRANLELLSEQEGVDRQGYVLRLGLCLADLDLQLPQDEDFYQPYFRVLETYLAATEKDYDAMLEQSRKTELWIVEENSQATQNCIDFCSLLYKPLQFLLSSLRKLQENKRQTAFTAKYTDFIKLRLNDVLKAQIQKYVKFLSDSLSAYPSKQSELALKPKRCEILTATAEQLSKQRYSFRQMTRRLYNLIFLKDQLEEIVCDFLEKGVYDQLGSSIFNYDKLQALISKPGPQKELLGNLASLSKLIVQTEAKLTATMGSITVFHFMRRLMSNLYYQQEKGFFSSKEDYKLSEFSFLKGQHELEEILITISRNLPPESADPYARAFCTSLFRAYRCEVLNVHKFKMPLSLQSILNYLKADVGFLCNTLKNKFIDGSILREQLQEPTRTMFKDMQKASQKLMQAYSEATLKNNTEQAKYLLAILNLRRQEKAEQFVQKYKKMLR